MFARSLLIHFSGFGDIIQCVLFAEAINEFTNCT